MHFIKQYNNKIDILLRQKLLMNYNPSMNLTENMRAVIVRIQKTVVDVNFVSPNFVNELANNMGRDLTSEQVVYISDHISYIDFIGLQYGTRFN